MGAWSSGMTLPLRGRDPRFKSSCAHLTPRGTPDSRVQGECLTALRSLLLGMKRRAFLTTGAVIGSVAVTGCIGEQYIQQGQEQIRFTESLLDAMESGDHDQIRELVHPETPDETIEVSSSTVESWENASLELESAEPNMDTDDAVTVESVVDVETGDVDDSLDVIFTWKSDDNGNENVDRLWEVEASSDAGSTEDELRETFPELADFLIH